MEKKKIKEILNHFYKKHKKELYYRDINTMSDTLDFYTKKKETDENITQAFRFCYVNIPDFSGKIEDLTRELLNRMEGKVNEGVEAGKQLKIIMNALIVHKKGKVPPEFEDIITKKLLTESWNFTELAENYNVNQIAEFKKDFIRTYKGYKLVEPLIELEDKKNLTQLTYFKKD